MKMTLLTKLIDVIIQIKVKQAKNKLNMPTAEYFDVKTIFEIEYKL